MLAAPVFFPRSVLRCSAVIAGKSAFYEPPVRAGGEFPTARDTQAGAAASPGDKFSRAVREMAHRPLMEAAAAWAEPPVGAVKISMAGAAMERMP